MQTPAGHLLIILADYRLIDKTLCIAPASDHHSAERPSFEFCVTLFMKRKWDCLLLLFIIAIVAMPEGLATGWMGWVFNNNRYIVFFCLLFAYFLLYRSTAIMSSYTFST